MKKSRIRIVVDIELETKEDLDTVNQKQILPVIQKEVDNFILKQGCLGDWFVRTKIEDPNKKHNQVVVDKKTPIGDISAYFSSDGPALHTANVIDYHPGYLDIPLDETFREINAALREAYHKYLTSLHSD
jgi:hypothetical protein